MDHKKTTLYEETLERMLIPVIISLFLGFFVHSSQWTIESTTTVFIYKIGWFSKKYFLLFFKKSV